MHVPVPKAKVTSAVWGHLDDMLITGHESGDLIQWDVSVSHQSLRLSGVYRVLTQVLKGLKSFFFHF